MAPHLFFHSVSSDTELKRALYYTIFKLNKLWSEDMGILKVFEDERKFVLGQIDLLYDSIENLRYEGKMSFRKNARLINQTVQHLKPILTHHKDLDDQVIFPYAGKHIPILEPMINFLKAERNEFIAQLESFEVLFEEFVSHKKGVSNYMLLEKLIDKGAYVVCIVRNHIQAEIEGIYKVLDQKLKLVEKKELCQLIQKNAAGFKKDFKIL